MWLTTLMVLGLSGQVQIEDIKYQTNLAGIARAELNIVTRLKNLRAATEKLPETWKASGIRGQEDRMLTKPYLLTEIENMELLAAERWALIVENTATIDVPHDQSDSKSHAFRKQLPDLSKAQLELNQKLDAFNTKLKDGILLNLASSLSN